MRILHILGNGFDLNLDLETSYKQFYKYYKTCDSKNPLINNLKNEIFANLDNWSDLEFEFGKYTENFKSVVEFDQVYDDLVLRLSEYLQLQESKAININKNNLFDCLITPEEYLSQADIRDINSFKSKWKNSPWAVNITTFNYTNTLEKILGEKIKDIKIGEHNSHKVTLQGLYHIHGFTHKDMVLGVNDISQVGNKSFHKNLDVLESLVKSRCNQVIKHTIDDTFKKLISEANLICIFGSSIGETDKIWWNLIGKQLKRECKLIILEKSEKISPLFSHRSGRRERKIKKHLLSFTGWSEEVKEELEKNIFVGINTEMFNVTNNSESVDDYADIEMENN